MSKHVPRPAATLALTLALAGCVQPAHMDAAVGSIVTPGNTQVPLPPGDWRQIAIQRNSSGTYVSGGMNNLHSVEVSYALVENGRFKSLVSVWTSADALAPYNPNAACLQNRKPGWTYLHEVDGGTLNNSDILKIDWSF